MEKTNVYILSIEPFTVSIKKNGRAVSVAVAKKVLAKEFPDASEDGWDIGIMDHKTWARRKDNWVKKSSLLED